MGTELTSKYGQPSLRNAVLEPSSHAPTAHTTTQATPIKGCVQVNCGSHRVQSTKAVVLVFGVRSLLHQKPCSDTLNSAVSLANLGVTASYTSTLHVIFTDRVPLKSHWQSGYFNERLLDSNTLRKLKKMVEDAEYERSRRKREGREILIKWFTAIAATIGALGGLATLVNLYRQTHP